MDWTLENGFEVSTDRARLDLPVIAGFLRGAYWSEGVPSEIVERSIEHSLPFGLYDADGAQAGFARVVSDRAVFAYLGDVFVLPQYRGQGLGVALVECVLAHPELQGLRRWHLATADAHELYRRFGFVESASPERHMFLERAAEELYRC
jgi:GNAT superfamily N-acetyltransferase